MFLRDALGNQVVTSTDAAGYYEFDSFGSLDGWASPWVLTPRRLLRYEEVGATISSLDASHALQMAVNIRPEPLGLSRVACDVTGDGSISALDAVRILRHRVDETFPVSMCGEWAFSPIGASGTQATLVPFTSKTCSEGRAELVSAGGALPRATVHFDAVVFGDCSDNWTPSPKPPPWVQELIPPLGSHFTFGAVTKAMAVDPQFNVIAVGETVGDVDISGFPATDPYGIFLAKYTSAGVPLWSRVWPRPSSGTVDAVATDSAGNIFVTGVQTGETFYGNGQVISPGGTKQVYVAKLRAKDGSVLWAQAFGSAASEQPGGVAATANGNLVVGMGFSGTLNVGGGDRVAAGSDGLVFSLSSSGQFLWDVPVRGVGENRVTAVSTSGGTITVGGWFAQTVEVGGTVLPTAGGYDGFVLELDAAGAVLDLLRVGGTGYETVESVARAANGAVAIVGTASGLDFPEPKASGFDSDGFVAVLDGDGSFLWGRRLGGLYADTAYDVAFDPENDVVVGGRFGDTVDFGGDSLVSLGQYDGFAAKYEGGSGVLQWVEHIAGSGPRDLDVVQTVTASEHGIYAAGQFNTELTWTGLNEGYPGNRAAFVARFDP